MAEDDALKVYWEHFFKAETGTYEKSTWLDLFLAEFLIRVNDGTNPKELIKFCSISGIVSLVGCELLCGIHRVTSSVNAHCSPLPPIDSCSGRELQDNDSTGVDPKAEDPRLLSSSALTRATAQSPAEILRQYLLKGPAWRSLVLLKALGVEGMSCCRQLSSVLVWVFGELRGAGREGDLAAPPVPLALPAPPSAKTPIHQLFSHKIWAKQKLTGSPGPKTNSVASSERGSAVSRSRHISQVKQDLESKPKRKQSKHSEQSSDTGDSTTELQTLTRSLTVKVCKPTNDFQYFDSPIKTSCDYPIETMYSDPFYVPKIPKPKAEDYMNDKHKEIINSEMSGFEFTLLIIDLLQELCKTESSLSGSEGSQVSVQCINFSLRNLCSLQFGSLPQPVQYSTEEASKVKVALTELLIVSLDKVLVHSDLCTKLINNGILPMLLRILEDVICKSSNKYAKDNKNSKEEKPNKTESDNLLKFVFGVAYSITAFFHCLLMQCRSLEKLRGFTDQFKLYGECLKGGLLKECIELMIRIPADEDEIVLLIKKLIESVGKLIVGMKRVRSEVIHSAACSRSRHKMCRQRVAAGMHHHHDILGEAGTGLPLASSCCISVLYGTLTSLVTNEQVSSQSLLRNKILRTILNSGACCCFSPGFLMESIVRLMLTHNNVATLCLQVLEHTVYGELGASVLMPKVTDQLPCSICEPNDDKRDLIRKYCPHGASPVERKSVWSFLIHYNSLLQLDNHNNVLHATVSHLLRVTPKCRMEMKYELLFSVIYPTFIVAKHRYIIRMEEAAYFLTVSCLNIFASLLNTVPFAEQFIQKGGLSYVLELVSLTEFSNQCCSILEIAVIVEIFKLMKENSDLIHNREISSLASVQMLFKSLTEMTNKCYKIYKLKLPDEKFAELCDVTKEREALALEETPRQETQSRKTSTPIVIKTSFASSENMIEESFENFLEVLKNALTFWKSCAGLCLYSPVFRRLVAGHRLLLDSYALLKLLLHCLCAAECGQPETRLLIKIVEALLTLQFAVSDVTAGRSKETSCGLVRSALSDAGALAAGGGGGLRALCEALVRVCVARPSRHHAMPRAHLAKVPPLGCESGASSAGGSSSEESTGAPYASEHSDPACLDLGYEADAEIGKLELLSLDRSKKLSGMSTSNTITGYAAVEDVGLEYMEQSKQSELAHPELCVIVVDVLTQLIHKLVSAPGECGAAGTAALARACCARLAGALAASRQPPPALLARLLTPAVTQLLTTTHHHTELQRSILELIHVVASQSISAAELGALLRLLAGGAPPLGALLAALRRLARRAAPHTPDAILSFPVHAHTHDNTNLGDDYVIVTGATSQSQQAEQFARRLHEAHSRAGIRSAWASGAARCGVEGAGWAPWLQGFGLLLWLRAAPAASAPPLHDDDKFTADEWQSEPEDCDKKSPKKEATARAVELSHVMSIGTESLILELWMDTNSGSLSLRLSRPELGANKPASEARVAGALPATRWACLALNVTERVHKRRIHIQVTVIVNGLEIETVSLPLQGILVRKVSPTVVLMGQLSQSPLSGAYHLSHALVYRAPVLAAGRALHLAAHGPDHSCAVRCETPNYPIVLTPEVLDLNIDWDQVYEISRSTLNELHDNLLLTFSAAAPNIMNLYHQTVSLPTVFAGSLKGGAASEVSVPEALQVTWAGAARASLHRGVAPAVYMLGGPSVLLYLFARVVELEGSGGEQAAALGVLLRVCGADGRLRAALLDAATLHMLHTVFASHKCVFSHHMLKVILDEACSSSILTTSGNSLVVCGRSDAVALEPRLLVVLMRAWRQLDTTQELSWEVEEASGARSQERGSLWALTLCCMRALVRDSHPRRAFNQYQLTRVRLLVELLSACKERFLNSECGSLGETGSSSLVELVRALLGSPPQLERLVQLADFLLLMHQASDTFVTHSRANFYFLLSGESVDAALAPRPPRPRAARTPRAPSSSSDDRSHATKHLKSIINTHIQEGRKHNISSASDNSDITLERSTSIEQKGDEVQYNKMENTACPSPLKEEEQPRGEEREDERSQGSGNKELKEYLVLDVDELNQTTANIYSSEIEQGQRAERAGEAGGAAREGLLLLLRDALAVLPDHALDQAVSGAVQAEALIVLGNQRSGRARAALVRALTALARRAPPALARKFKQQHYYLHLANQIALYPARWELAAACAALLTKCDVPLEDQLDDDIWLDVTEEAVLRSPPLLALLPTCLEDVPLAHNISLIIRRLIDKASLKTLNEVSVAEVVVKAIRGVGQLGDMEFEGRDLLLEDLFELLNRLAMKSLNSQHNMQTIELHHMLTYVEWTAAGRGETTVVRVARDAQHSLYMAQLDYLEERLHTSYSAHTKYANYFTTVLSSAVSRGAEAGSRAERAELAARHAAVIVRAVSFLLSRSPALPAQPEAPLVHRLFATLLPAVAECSPARAAWWAGGGADWVSPLQELFSWAGAPAAGVRALQPALLRALYRAPPAAPPLLAHHDPPAMRKLAVYLLSMLKHIHAAAEAGAPAVELAITDWAREWAVGTQAGLAERVPSDSLADEAARLLAVDEQRWAKAAAKQRAAVTKVVWSKEALAGRLAEGAMALTRQVVDVQNGERKAFMEQLRRAHAHSVAATQRWQRLVDAYTHEQAVWHDARSYPQSWQLDATEGPGRVRVRLRRAHLHIPAKFLKPAHRAKLDPISRSAPLRSVVGAGGGLRGGLVARLQLHETVAYMARVTCVTVARDTPGELLLSDRCIHFVPEDCEQDAGAGAGAGADRRAELQAGAHSWPLEAVVQVATRRWCLQERACELFLSSGQAHLIAFEDATERDAFLKALDACHLPGRLEADSLGAAMAAWRSGAITNWEYLMRLNGLAGRTYNDLMQYPVLPFVLADYGARILDLREPRSFRDLARPMAVQNKAREQHYINTYNDLCTAGRAGCSALLRSARPHHYASLYSNSGGVLHYLVRLPPFTELFLNYQDNNFDMPDRTFHSLATTWRLITNDSPTDVKELIPELFYLPELFHNNEGLNLGVRQCGAGVDDVELPPWAPDSRIFTLIHRQALEAPYVSENLPHWIDLVFGYKQTGQAAIDAINVFPACTYYGFDPSALEDEVDRTAAAAMVRTYGQAPRQLLRSPHPRRAPDLLPAPQHQLSVWAGVEGARWGQYCGSPALGAARVLARRACPGATALQALPHARAAHHAAARTALQPLAGESSAMAASGAYALVSWGHSDNIVRLKRRRDARPDLLLPVPALDQITKVTTSCLTAGCPHPIFVGHSSGRVLGVWLRGEPARAHAQPLLAHSAPITDMHMCARAGLLATASADGKIVLWDLNNLSYIRTLPNREMLPVSLVTISATLCDVASVHAPPPPRAPAAAAAAPAPSNEAVDNDSDSYEKDSTYKYKSLVRVHTVNARFVGSVKVAELVTSICYSAAPEGVSVNCIACGLRAGGVRLYSAWDLRHVASIPPADNCLPLTSLTYSSDSSVLFGCYADGLAVAWGAAGAGGGGGGKPAPARLLPAHALL